LLWGEGGSAGFPAAQAAFSPFGGFPARLLNFPCSDLSDHNSRSDYVGGALLTSGASGHYVGSFGGGGKGIQ
jgi:hypothetical protein